MTGPRACRGFTLIETLVVVAVIATLSSIILPSLLGARVSAGESSALATLRVISSAQQSFAVRKAADRDGDGNGEHGFFAEMAGALAPPGAVNPIDPPILPGAFRLVSGGFVNRAGYLFRVVLPGAGGLPANEALTGGEDSATPVDPDLAEAIWVAYCWPAVRGTTGFRVFCVNQAGEILQTSNIVQSYTGYMTPVPPDAAFTLPNNIASPLAYNAIGQDGETWKPVK